MKEINDINKRDWRLQAITTLSKDWKSPFTGKVHKKGMIVENVNYIKILKKSLIMPIPNPTALFINLSHSSYLKAIKFLKFFSEEDFIELDLRQKEESFFNGLENLMASVIFAYCSLESFANEIIPDNYEFKLFREDNKCTELYNKEQIERNLLLKIKLGEILPDVTGIEIPKDKSLWDKFIELERIRNDIIHMKSRDRKGVDKDTMEISLEYIWNRLLNDGNIKDYSKISLEIITLFHNKKKPRWLNMYPY